MNRDQAIDQIQQRLSNPFWTDRAADMLRHLCIGSNCDSDISGLRVCSDWPSRGSITFTRAADQKKFRLFLQKGRNGKFIGRPA